ncbi:MAG TPA: HU family DNA-binding protein [Gemmatimonadales bacterium]
MNKAELIDELANRAGLAKTDAARAVEAMFGMDGIIVDALRGGAKIQLTGFGSFQARPRAARTGRDPRTGNAIQIKASVQPVFKAGQGFKDALNP